MRLLSKYNVGDKVTIKSWEAMETADCSYIDSVGDIKIGMSMRLYFMEEMRGLCGTEQTIETVFYEIPYEGRVATYELTGQEDNYLFCDAMFEEPKDEE